MRLLFASAGPLLTFMDRDAFPDENITVETKYDGTIHTVSAARILIVEDESIVAADLRKQLSRLGYKIEGHAKSGEEAVRLARQLSPNLILMDIRLLGPLDGLETAKRINNETPIPVVYITAYSNLLLDKFRDMQPPHLCVAKPFSLEDLQQVIEIALRSDVTPVSVH